MIKKLISKVFPRFKRVIPSSRARRPIGLAYDEFTRGFNPFNFIESAGVADASDPIETIIQKFNTFGIVKVRGVYSPKEAKDLQKVCTEFTALTPSDFHLIRSRKKKWASEWGGGRAAAIRHYGFWTYVNNKIVENLALAVLGEESFEFGGGASVHQSSRGLHRNFEQIVGNKNSPYHTAEPSKRIIRSVHFCGQGGGSIGYIPFSHDERKYKEQAPIAKVRHSLAWFNRHRAAINEARKTKDFARVDEMDRFICWLHADRGDVIIFNAALLHCDGYLTGPIYNFVSSHAENDEFTLPEAMKNVEAYPELAIAYYSHMMSNHGFHGSHGLWTEACRYYDEAMAKSFDAIDIPEPIAITETPPDFPWMKEA